MWVATVEGVEGSDITANIVRELRAHLEGTNAVMFNSLLLAIGYSEREELMSHEDDAEAIANAVYCPNCGPAGCLCDWAETKATLPVEFAKGHGAAWSNIPG